MSGERSGAAAGRGGVATDPAASGAPQPRQKRAAAETAVPQAAQLRSSAAPQPSQNRESAGLWCPQAAQLTGALYRGEGF